MTPQVAEVNKLTGNDVWLAKRKLAEDSLRSFVEQAWDVLEPGTKFIPGMHVDAVCEHL